jgi:hypothetical protein
MMSARCVAIVLGLASIAGAQPAGPARMPVVVELFTSEGCSSCPPADALLSTLAWEQDVPGAEVIALGLHVTYWDDLGWKDPFSSRLATDRQQQYSRVFGEDRIYTPQIVVDGREEMVGSDAQAVRAAILRQTRGPHTRIALEPHWDERGVTSRIVVPDLPTGVKESLDLLLFVTEGHLSTQVKRGENASRLLKHDAVVRGMVKVATLDGKTRLPFEAEGFLGAGKDESARPANPWNVVAILQGRNSGRIWASGIR